VAPAKLLPINNAATSPGPLFGKELGEGAGVDLPLAGGDVGFGVVGFDPGLTGLELPAFELLGAGAGFFEELGLLKVFCEPCGVTAVGFGPLVLWTLW
jgi:hypothetical protein